MEKSEKSTVKQKPQSSLGLYVALFFAALGVSAFLFQPTVRAFTTSLVFSPDRKILSVIRTEFKGIGYKILKVREKNRLFIEVYGVNDTEESEPIDAILMKDRKDAFFKIDGAESNLFMQDINDDAYPEIVAPSFDRNMKAHLNVFTFDLLNLKIIRLSNY